MGSYLGKDTYLQKNSMRLEMCAEHTIGGGGEKKKRSRRRRRRRRRRDFLSAAAEAAKIVGGGGVGGVEPFYQHQYISKFVWPLKGPLFLN